tara:strand:+ start:1009 stop:1356 length:348 start_codon:yes stop_codon:yes gene_type:complete
MPISTKIKSTLLSTLQSSINTMVLGFDGTPATNDDGGAGRPAITLTPTVTIVDDTTLLVEASLPIANSFTDSIREVVLLSKDANGVFSCIARYNTKPIIKTTQNEVKIEISIEVI